MPETEFIVGCNLCALMIKAYYAGLGHNSFLCFPWYLFPDSTLCGNAELGVNNQVAVIPAMCLLEDGY